MGLNYPLISARFLRLSTDYAVFASPQRFALRADNYQILPHISSDNCNAPILPFNFSSGISLYNYQLFFAAIFCCF